MGVDELFFHLSSGQKSKTVVYTRSLEPIYDVETLLRSIPLVVKTIPDARFIIAGSGTQEASLKALAQEVDASGHIQFLGHIPSDQIPALMEQASVYVSTAIADGTSPALLEAIAAGLTPVTTDIEANRTLVKDGQDGFLFKPQDPGELAEKITRALSGDIPAAVIEQKRREFMARISWGSVARGFISNYTRLGRKDRG